MISNSRLDHQNTEDQTSSIIINQKTIDDINDCDFETYEIDDELERYLDMEYNINKIYDYIKKISNKSIIPLFDKLSKSELTEFLYFDIDLDDKFFF